MSLNPLSQTTHVQKNIVFLRKPHFYNPKTSLLFNFKKQTIKIFR